MKVSVEETSGCERVLTIEVPSEKVTEEAEAVYREISKTATHPGFRKGKVPRKIIEAKHAASIRQEAVSATISSSVREAIEEKELIPLAEPELGEVDSEGDGPLSFKVTIEVKPSVELGEYKGIEIKTPKREVTDEDVDRVIERMRLSHAKHIPADRAVERDDLVAIDFQAFQDGEPVKEGKGENLSLEVGSGQFGEDFESQLIGMAKDEERRIKVRYPDDYKAQDLAGKEVEFDVKVKDVKLRELPELDDEFAKDLGEHETLDELKKSVKERIAEDLEKRKQDHLREQALTNVIAGSKLDVPTRFKTKVAASVFEEQVKNLMQYGTDRETITAQRDQIVEFADKEAERQLKVSFVTDEIAEREGIGVSDEDLEKSLDEMTGASEDGGANLKEYFKQESVRERYRDQLRAKKILDFIVDGAKIEEVDEVETEESEQDNEGES